MLLLMTEGVFVCYLKVQLLCSSVYFEIKQTKVKANKMSMDEPQKFNELTATKKGIQEFLNTAKNKLTWNETEKVLDVGCGPGSVTAAILPLLLPDNTSIVGSDISEKMIEFAKKNYSNDNVSFSVMDICDDNLMASWNKAEFSKIFSFNCFHRVENKRKAFENVYSMLMPGGEFVVQLILDCYWFKAHKYLIQKSKYKIYEKQLLSTIPDKDFTDRLVELLQNIGFEVIYTAQRIHKTPFNTRDNFYEFLQLIATMPYFVPKDVCDDIMAEIRTPEAEKLLLGDIDEGYFYNYGTFSFVARKPL